MRKVFLAFLAVSMFLISPVRAEVVVVAVTGTTEYAPGQQLQPGDTVSLEYGERITVLMKTGDMTVLSGPFEGPATKGSDPSGAGKPMDGWDVVMSLIGSKDTRTEVFGATRNLEGNVPPTPGVWHVSTDSSGPRCTKPDGFTLWRRDASKHQAVSARSETARLKGVSWLKGQNELDVPMDFVTSQEKVLVSVDDTIRDFEINVLPSELDISKPGLLLGWMIESKCHRQANALIGNIHAKNDVQ